MTVGRGLTVPAWPRSSRQLAAATPRVAFQAARTSAGGTSWPSGQLKEISARLRSGPFGPKMVTRESPPQ